MALLPLVAADRFAAPGSIGSSAEVSPIAGATASPRRANSDKLFSPRPGQALLVVRQTAAETTGDALVVWPAIPQPLNVFIMHPIRALVELGIYADDLAAAKSFYGDLLGLKLVASEADRHLFFAVGDGMLLVFRPAATLKGDILPPHGAHGPAHFALGIDAEDLDPWRARLAEHNIAIEKEMHWPRGGRSIYFRDPAGNSVELVTKGLWGLPSGW